MNKIKTWGWREWTAVALVLAIVIAAVVLHLVQPSVSFSFTELLMVISFSVGGVVGYLLKSILSKYDTVEHD